MDGRQKVYVVAPDSMFSQKFHSFRRFNHQRLLSSSPTPPGAPIDGVTAWTTRLRELSKLGLFSDALTLYQQMLRLGDSSNAFTFPFALKSCASLVLPITGMQLHGHVFRTGCGPEPFVLTSLITMYSQCGFVENARQVFDESPQASKMTVCFNALISGYAFNSRLVDAVILFGKMREMSVSFNSVTMLGLIPACALPAHLDLGTSLHCCIVKCGLETDSSTGNCLLTMYVKCGSIQNAQFLFNSIPKKGLITWNAMISGYAQNGLASNVLDLYQDMKLQEIRPDPVTLVGVLSSCANLGAHSIGSEVEKQIEVRGFGSNPFLNNALINMYARCGQLVKARAVFDSMPVKTVITWTAMIGGYGMHGHGQTAVELFDEMLRKGTKPDRTAFVSVLSACSHAGLTDKGMNYLDAMKKRFGLQPGPEHYACVVDLLGRGGQLTKALDLIRSMRVDPDGAVWGALLGACRIHRNVEIAELAFEKVVELEPENTGYYILLSNIYNEAENLDGVLKVRVMMRNRKLRKEPGCSYIEYNGRVHLFLAGDRSHPQTEEIYRLLDELEDSVKELAGLNKDEELVGSGIAVHSEKLAVIFALLNSGPNEDIVVIKNLRICGDCHLFIKLVSKVMDRHFIVRDATRFHHFNNGTCSCRDYW